MGGIGAAVLGRIADLTGIIFVYKLCAWLPAIGLLAGLLPDLDFSVNEHALKRC